MPTVTSTRPVVGDQVITVLLNGTEIQRSEVQAALGGSAPVQTTTSYRTGRHINGVEVDEDLKLLSSKTYGDVRQELYSQERRNRKSPFDSGHPFSTEIRQVSDVTMYETSSMAGTNKYDYKGPLYPIIPSGVQRFLNTGPFDGTYYGTEAIRRTAPTSPSMSLLGALVELKREGLPALPGLAAFSREDVRALGNEYLNLEFGFKPLAHDAAALAEIVIESNRILEQYRRDSGKQVRRSYSFPVERSATSVLTANGEATHWGSGGVTPWVTIGNVRVGTVPGRLLRTSTVTRRIYFSGAYVYHLPVSSSLLGNMRRIASQANHLLGAEITPALLWNLSPWTWLADWNFNIGSILSNVEAFSNDSLVLRYGYLMCHTVTRNEFTLSRTQLGNYKSGPAGPFTSVFVTEKKERVRASPYGFALNPSAYTGRQWAILAALGLTKAPNVLP